MGPQNIYQYGDNMREKIVTPTNFEDIISYECNYPGKFVKILIGSGTKDSTTGNFIPAPEQGYEYIVLQNEDFDNLMKASGEKPAGVFRKEDLWPYVDYLRPIIEAERLLGKTR